MSLISNNVGRLRDDLLVTEMKIELMMVSIFWNRFSINLEIGFCRFSFDNLLNMLTALILLGFGFFFLCLHMRLDLVIGVCSYLRYFHLMRFLEGCFLLE